VRGKKEHPINGRAFVGKRTNRLAAAVAVAIRYSSFENFQGFRPFRISLEGAPLLLLNQSPGCI